jgi:hypothetical protein
VRHLRFDNPLVASHLGVRHRAVRVLDIDANRFQLGDECLDINTAQMGVLGDFCGCLVPLTGLRRGCSLGHLLLGGSRIGVIGGAG